MTNREKTYRKTRSKLLIRAGLRYLRNDGKETGEIILTHSRQSPYFDPLHQLAYTEQGIVWYGTLKSSENLVSTISNAK